MQLSILKGAFLQSFLISERERLGYSQKEVFEKLGVNKATFYRWERGSPIPSDKLAMLDDMGFDIRFVIKGSRTVKTKRVAELVELIDSLLVKHNRQVTPQGKARIIAGLLELEMESDQQVQADNILPFVTAAGF